MYLWWADLSDSIHSLIISSNSCVLEKSQFGLFSKVSDFSNVKAFDYARHSQNRYKYQKSTKKRFTFSFQRSSSISLSLMEKTRLWYDLFIWLKKLDHGLENYLRKLIFCYIAMSSVILLWSHGHWQVEEVSFLSCI